MTSRFTWHFWFRLESMLEASFNIKTQKKIFQSSVFLFLHISDVLLSYYWSSGNESPVCARPDGLCWALCVSVIGLYPPSRLITRTLLRASCSCWSSAGRQSSEYLGVWDCRLARVWFLVVTLNHPDLGGLSLLNKFLLWRRVRLRGRWSKYSFPVIISASPFPVWRFFKWWPETPWTMTQISTFCWSSHEKKFSFSFSSSQRSLRDVWVNLRCSCQSCAVILLQFIPSKHFLCSDA